MLVRVVAAGRVTGTAGGAEAALVTRDTVTATQNAVVTAVAVRIAGQIVIVTTSWRDYAPVVELPIADLPSSHAREVVAGRWRL